MRHDGLSVYNTGKLGTALSPASKYCREHAIWNPPAFLLRAGGDEIPSFPQCLNKSEKTPKGPCGEDTGGGQPQTKPLADFYNTVEKMGS